MPASTLKTRKEFVQVADAGHRHASHSVVVQFLAHNPPDAPTRFGVTVTKRTFKRAVDRNRVKRRLREIFRQTLQTTPELPSGHYVLIGRQAALEAPFDILQRDVTYCLRKLQKHDKTG